MPLALRALLGRFLSGIVETFGAVRRISRIKGVPSALVAGRAVVFRGSRQSPRLLVVAPPIGGDENSPNVRALVARALSTGWTVAVHSRDREALFDTAALRVCIEVARGVTGLTGAPTGVVGLSVGGIEACKARLPYPVVSISNAYDIVDPKKHRGRVISKIAPLAWCQAGNSAIRTS